MRALFALALLACLHSPAAADTWTSDQTSGSVADTELRNNWGSILGNITNNEVRHQQPGLSESPRRFIIRCETDFTTVVPSGSQVDAAFVYIRIASFFEMSSEVLSAHEVPEAWEELQATWANRVTGTAWTSPGAWGAPGDGGPNLSTYSGPYAAGTWVRFDITSYVAGVVAATKTQNGVLVKRDIEITTGAGVVRYHTSEAGTQGDRPYFEIHYSASAGPGYAERVPLFLPR